MRWGGVETAALAQLTLPRNATLLEALRALDENAESIVCVCDEAGVVVGTLTDGDVRRALLRGASLASATVSEAMQREFIAVPPTAGRAEVLDLMRARNIGQVPVVDATGKLCGLHTVGRLLSHAVCPNAAVILAGGRGTRLAPLTHTIPKPMVTVAGRPILERLILHLMSCGVRQFYLSVNYLAHVIEDYFGDGHRLGCHITYLREERPLGTGGPLSLLSPVPADPVIVLNGDLVTQCDVTQMLDFHLRGNYVATVGLRSYAVEIPFGAAQVDGDRLVTMHEKPIERKLVNTGMYIFSPEAIRRVPSDREYPITSLLDQCLDERLPVGAYMVNDEWLDVGRPEELNRARGT